MITIIDYGAGNIRSVQNALKRLGAAHVVTDDAETIKVANKVILPGVGEAKSAMQMLRAKGLHALIPSLTQPVLGICLGLQLMCLSSEEGDTKGMGIFNARVLRFPAKGIVPHMGWNDFSTVKGSLYKGIHLDDHMYFVHSYYAEVCKETSAACEYLTSFSASLEKDNFYAAQFHPEKSAEAGNQFLQNFLML